MIALRGVAHNNLAGFDLDVPHGQLVCITGVSGSGKSSLAFDTLFAEGQRRYVECLSSYARQFLDRMDKPKVREITGILPAVALRQGRGIRSARATVATLCDAGELFRAVFAHAASPQCPRCGAAVVRQPLGTLADELLTLQGRRAVVAFELPVVSAQMARASLDALAGQGFHRALVAGQAVALADALGPDQVGTAVQVIVDRVVLEAPERPRLLDSLTQALQRGAGIVSVFVETPVAGAVAELPSWRARGQSGALQWLRAATTRRCTACGEAVADPAPQLFSASSAVGACPTCNGFGRLTDIDLDRVIPDRALSLNQGAIKPWSTEATVDEREALANFCARLGIDLDAPFVQLSAQQQQLLTDGEPGKARGRFKGVRGWFAWLQTKTYKMHVRVLLARYRAYTTCPGCHGARLRPEARAWRLGGLDLPGWLQLPMSAVKDGLRALQLDEMSRQAVHLPLQDLTRRVELLDEIGLPYLTLDRPGRTLSGGELQRVQLVAALATGLSQVLYVLDEPSIGLHARDNDRLLRILQRLKAAGNTVVVVEHDPALVLAADTLIELGPGAGSQGGQLLYVGPTAGLQAVTDSPSAQYLFGGKQVDTAALDLALVAGRRKVAVAQGWMTIVHPTARNLQGQDVQLRLGALNAVCGVSGSGKSTLVEETLYRGLLRARGESTEPPGACQAIAGGENFREIVYVDQQLPQRSARANCATYLKLWDCVRARLAQEPLALQRGYTAATFSFNKGGGRCATCEGLGTESVEMQFLADVHMRCETCGGLRFKAEVLDVRHGGWNAARFLDATCADVAAAFGHDKGLFSPAEALCQLGLGYLRLGQPLATLSGGEAQRVKIAWHLLQAGTKNALFLLDEPSTGLHLHDVAVLLRGLRQLVHVGNTVVVVEHHLDLIAAADHVVELGPEGGPDGGRVLYQGELAGLLERLDSPTARFLRQHRLRGQYVATPGLEEGEQIQRDPGCIEVRGARVHNLKNVSLDVLRNQFTVVTGLSGSGKSSLAFDVVFAEGQRRFLDCLSPFARQYLPPAMAPEVDALRGLPPTVAIAQRTTRGGPRSTVATLTDAMPYLRLLYARCGVQQCPRCGGEVGGQTVAAVAAAIRLTLAQGQVLYVLAPAVRGRKGMHHDVIERARALGHRWLQVDGAVCALQAVPPLRRHVVHDLDFVVARLAGGAGHDLQQVLPAVEDALALGEGTIGTRTGDGKSQTWSLRRHCARCDLSVEAPDPRLFAFTSPAGWCPKCEGTGVVNLGEQAKAKPVDPKSREELEKAALPDGGEDLPDVAERRGQPCAACHGSRLRPEALAVTLGGVTIDRALQHGPTALLQWLQGLQWSARDSAVAEPVLTELHAKCAFLGAVGLDYLALGRGAVTLSGGESQRLRLAAQLSSNLRGVLYVLDEPTIGLHPEDNQRVLQALQALGRRGNGLLVVEHDEATIRCADQVIELGPGGGSGGGEVVFQGTVAELVAHPGSPTGRMLRDRGTRRVRTTPRLVDTQTGFVALQGACRNNLRQVSAQFAHGRFNVVTGVSGSGKSTLVRDLLVTWGNFGVTVTDRRSAAFTGNEELAALTGIADMGRVVEIDQSPIGRTPRSCPATFVGVLDPIRLAFAALPDAKVAGLGASAFSFNVAGGRCEICGGAGKLKIAMSFLPTVHVPCEACGGRRYGDRVLGVRYKGASIADVLAMSIEAAATHFAALGTIARPLQLATRIGLGYLQLGQSSDTLSGGEAQRLKLVTELAKRRKVATVYVLDEPTTGLHGHDVRQLLAILHDLVDRGDTLVVIEHQLDVVREADWMVDMGPGAGQAGGHVTYQGPVAEFVARGPDVPTRRALLR